MSCIYKLTFPNDAVYIGKTSMNPEQRWRDGWGYKNMPAIFNFILHYGWVNVKKEIVADNLTKEEATEREAELIKYYSRKALAQYDLHSEDDSTDDVAQSASHSDDRCTMILNDYGVDPEYLMAQQRGYITPDALKAEKEVEKPVKKVVNGHRVGAIKSHVVPLVEKPKEMRICPVKVYNTDGDMLAIYPSVQVASEETGVSPGDVVCCCKGSRPDGKPRYQSKGLVFRYAPYVNGI